MGEPLVIGLDSSTQSTKAIAWNQSGQCIAEGRADVPMSNPRMDCFEQNPQDWWLSAKTALKGCCSQVNPSDIQGLAISNQRETLGFMDADGNATYPAVLWLDERAREQVKTFSKSFGHERIHKITGRMPDITPCLYTFVWMREHEPEVWQSTECFVDVQAYLVSQLCGGEYRTGWISADPMGIFDMVGKRWSSEILEAISLDTSRLPHVHPPGTELGRLSSSAASETGLPANMPVFAAGGDGQCAGLGVNCTVPDRAYVNLGTAVVSGIWSPDYRYSRAWRTELAAQGEGYIYENCLRSGAFLVNWFVDQFVAHGKADAAVFEKLEAAALKLPIGSEGLLVSPYFSGVMDPHWDVGARGAIIGLSGSHTESHIYRAIIEAITLDQAMRTADMEIEANQPCSHVVAIGGGANSALWKQMLADAMGKPVHISTTIEASALGAGMIAAYGAGWFDSITQASEHMAGSTSIVEPVQSRYDSYQSLLSIYRKLYHATANLSDELTTFAAAQQRS
ncbi:MAG: FGGY-family carbohydrate kinase [Granulosicoccus sp.]|nr:FGGY-family carbohydrate kinase [Granulosicoccus sp.]